MKPISILLTLALASCAETEATPASDVAVALSSVTLADDCKPATPPAPAKVARTPSTPAVVAPADCPAAPCGRPCDQTSMQIAIKTSAGAPATTIKIKKVELLDAKGKLLEVLAARSPSKWKTNAYAAWDEKLAGGDDIKVMYELAAPSWDKLTNGRWNAHTKTFQLRVTVTVGTADRTVEKQAITPVRLPPAVPT